MTYDLDHIFTYHAPLDADGKPDQTKIDGYTAIRAAAKNLTAVILQHTPPCADQSAAVRKVREAVMTANAGIALDGRLHEEPADGES